MPIRPFLHPALIAMGLHVASVRVRRAVLGHRRYPGGAEEILRAGLEACWSGEFLTASPGTYRQFWTRDLGFAAPSLVRMGGPWPGRVLSSLEWAIAAWTRGGGHVTTTINPLLRWPVDIFDYGVDSLPLLLHTLRVLEDGAGPAADPATNPATKLAADGAAALAHEHRDWIAAEVQHFVDTVVDPATGLVRSDRHFSAHRDTFKNGSTAYANAMVAVLARTIAETGWAPDLLSRHFVADDRKATSTRDGRAAHAVDSPPLAMPVAGISSRSTPPIPPRIPPTRIGEEQDSGSAKPGTSQAPRIPPTRINEGGGIPANLPAPRQQLPDWGKLLHRHFWIGDRFRDRLGSDETSGEANVWPFHAGLIDDREMLAAALTTLDREGYTTPYPLRFDVAHSSDRLMLAYRLWSADYQTTTSWTSLGSIYLSLLRAIDPASAAAGLDAMRRLIERDGVFWEVLDGAGRPWRSRSRLSTSDVSMLWGAILLEELVRARDAAGIEAA